MDSNIRIIKNILIKEHEMIIKSHLKELMDDIESDGHIRNPIIVDRNSMVILDGHHRFNAIKHLGFSSSPVHLVDYQSRDIKVVAWRDGENVTKQMVVTAGLSGKLMVPKTSRHIIPGGPLVINIPLEKLI